MMQTMRAHRTEKIPARIGYSTDACALDGINEFAVIALIFVATRYHPRSQANRKSSVIA